MEVPEVVEVDLGVDVMVLMVWSSFHPKNNSACATVGYEVAVYFRATGRHAQ